MLRRNFLASSGISSGLDQALADCFDVKRFGVVGDGVVDDSRALQFLIDQISVKGGVVFFPPGVYLLANIILRPNVSLKGCGPSSIVRAISSAKFIFSSHSYFLDSAYADPPLLIDSLLFDGRGLVDSVLIFRSYFSTISNCWFSGGRKHDLLVTSDGQHGAKLQSTMVNNRISECFFGHESSSLRARSSLEIRSSNNVCTDYHISGCFFRGASRAGLVMDSSAGMLMDGNHFYGSPVGAVLRKYGVGTIVANNYFEVECVVEDFLPKDFPATIAGGNIFLRGVLIKCGGRTVNFVSRSNVFGRPIMFVELHKKVFASSVGDVFNRCDILRVDNNKDMLDFNFQVSTVVSDAGSRIVDFSSDKLEMVPDESFGYRLAI